MPKTNSFVAIFKIKFPNSTQYSVPWMGVYTTLYIRIVCIYLQYILIAVIVTRPELPVKFCVQKFSSKPSTCNICSAHLYVITYTWTHPFIQCYTTKLRRFQSYNFQGYVTLLLLCLPPSTKNNFQIFNNIYNNIYILHLRQN